MAFPSGWPVMTQTMVRRERWPGGHGMKGIPLVSPGQRIAPDQAVLRVERKNISASEEYTDHPAATRQGHKTEIIPAGLYGQVVEITPRGGVVIECYASVLQGTLGAGKQVAGILTMWRGSNQPGKTEHIGRLIPPGAILVIPGPINFMLLHQARNSGVVGIIASSISVRDLEGFLHTDLIQLLTSRHPERLQDDLPPLTILLTEGVGNATMPARVLNLLNQYQGAVALLSGFTSPRQHIFPELIISLPLKEARQYQPTAPLGPQLTTGVLVRIHSGDYKGMIGVVDHLFAHQQVFPSGIRAEAVRLRLEDGSMLVVPVALVERIG
jgi:hypothetical protein